MTYEIDEKSIDFISSLANRETSYDYANKKRKEYKISKKRSNCDIYYSFFKTNGDPDKPDESYVYRLGYDDGRTILARNLLADMGVQKWKDWRNDI